MKVYLDLLHRVLEEGKRQPNRTGIDTLFIPGAMMQFDLARGFPAVTTKKLAFKSAMGELVGFMRGYDNAAQFRTLGCNFWDANANENAAWLANANRRGDDDLGRIYGVQWRRWRNSDGGETDQLVNAIRTIMTDPTSRRIIISAWRPDELDKMALPPCHCFAQFIVDTTEKSLNLLHYQRSIDLLLGAPVNCASYSAFLCIVARLTGYTPHQYTFFLGDAHIYVNHIEQVREQLSREPFDAPELEISDRITPLTSAEPKDIAAAIEMIEPQDLRLANYRSHAAIKAAMAV